VSVDGRSPAARGVVDVNVEIGPASRPSDGGAIEDVVSARTRHGIRLALVRERTAVTVGTAYGRERLSAAITADPSLVPVATVSVSAFSAVEPELRLWIREGAKAIWIEPGDRWAAVSESATRTLRAAASFGLPLLVPDRHAGDAETVGALTAGLGVPIILVGVHYARYTATFGALDRYPHLSIETSALGTNQAIRAAAARIGAERVLFGSGAPRRTPASPINAVLFADLRDDDKRLILAGNAERLFGLPAVAPDLRPPPVPERVFDVHSHVFPAPWEVPDVEPADLMPTLRRYGVRRTVSSSVAAIVGDLEQGNARAVAAARVEQGQLVYLVADANDVELARAHLERWGRAPGVVGVKVHCHYAGLPTSSPKTWELFRVLARYGRPVKIHNTGADWVEAITAIAREHPRLPIVIAHAGLGVPTADAARAVAGGDRVYVELSSSAADIRECRALVRAIPAERLLFGSDAPLMDPAFVLGIYQDLGLDDATFERVLWDNAVAAFGVD